MSDLNKKKGFDYYLSKEVIDEYRKTPLDLRLKWLYAGNVLRMGYDKKTIDIQDRLREGKL